MRLSLRLTLGVFAIVCLAACGPSQKSPDSPKSDSGLGRELRVMHVMSFHSPWPWTDDQLAGFKNALADCPTAYQVFQLDLKRHNDAAWQTDVARRAKDEIDQFKPDLLFLSDDGAQKLVGMQYVGQALPIVFSGVNRDAQTYDYAGAPNVSGVLEREHFVESVALLQQIVPTVKRIAVVFDKDDTNWRRLEAAMREQAAALTGVSFPRWLNTDSYAEFQKAMIEEFPKTVDAVCLVGIFAFKDAAGRPVPYETVSQWVVDNSQLPDFSFWDDRVNYGTLLSVSVDGRSHGYAAGLIARRILVDKTPPSQIPVQNNSKGSAFVNSKRAKALGIKLSSTILLNVNVVDSYKWEAHAAR